MTLSLEKETMIEEISIVHFKVGNVNFGVDVYQIRDIIRIDAITRVPNCDDFVMGVINLRGQILPVVNLRKRLSFDEVNYGEEARILIIEFNGELSGLIVDRVYEVLQLATHKIEPRPRYLVQNIDANFLIGLGSIELQDDTLQNEDGIANQILRSEFILLLDVAKVLNSIEKQKNQSILKKIVDRKTTLLKIERVKIKNQLKELKEQEKTDILASLSKTATMNIATATKNKDQAFLEKQQEIMNKIKQSQYSTLKISLEEKDSLDEAESEKD